MFTRRKLIQSSGIAIASAALTGSISQPANAVEVNEDGLHVQDWFLESFMEIGEDHKEANNDGKHLAILFEQRGCPYCAEMHSVNFAKSEIKEFIKEKFNILQVNLWGSKNVTDLDGEELGEREFSQKWGVNFTPTIVFLKDGDIENKPLKEAEATRMPGYFKPFHFVSMFEYVSGKHYENEQFQRFLQAKFKRLEEEGKKPDIW